MGFIGLNTNKKAEKLAQEQQMSKMEDAVNATAKLWQDLKLNHYEALDICVSMLRSVHITVANIMKGNYARITDLESRLEKYEQVEAIEKPQRDAKK